MFGKAPLSDESIRRVLLEQWGLYASRIVYAPVGYGSYHWRVASSDGAEFFVTADPTGTGDVVPLAYRVARRLADEGLRFVRAPVQHRESDVTWEMDGCWISVWPWLDGRTASAPGDRATADVEATARCLRALHDHRSLPLEPGLVEDWAIAGRSSLFALLAPKGEEWGAGPYVNDVRTRLSANRETVVRQFRRYEGLVESALGPEIDLVITHGEPHAGNVVHTDEGLMLIDWDTVRWAPRERDLWALDGPWRPAYGEVPISADILEAYRLQWSLSEIAEFAVDLTAAESRNPDLDVAERELCRYLPKSEASPAG